jgi:hypothetical protein
VTAQPKTAKGCETRERIVTAASELLSGRGVAVTSLDDVIDRGRRQQEPALPLPRGPGGAAPRGHRPQHGGRHPLLGRGRRQLDRHPSVARLNGRSAGRTQGLRRLPGRIACPQLSGIDEKARLAPADAFRRTASWIRAPIRNELATAPMAAIQDGLL